MQKASVMEKERHKKITNKEVLKEIRSIQEQLNVLQKTTEGIIDHKQAAKILGVSTGYLYQLTSSGKVPYYKVAKLNYFLISDLVAWIKEQDQLRKSRIQVTTTDERQADQSLRAHIK